MRTTNIGRDVANPFGCAVGSHCHGAAVNYCRKADQHENHPCNLIL
ncbi:hypothetical protein Nmel_003595 [Mimus melanotis]